MEMNSQDWSFMQNGRVYIYYWTKRNLMHKKQFIKSMKESEYNPKLHGMMNWDEYIEIKWQMYKEEKHRKLDYVSYDPQITSKDEVIQRIKSRVKGFLGFYDEMFENQIVTDETTEIPLKRITFQELMEEKEEERIKNFHEIFVTLISVIIVLILAFTLYHIFH